MGCGCSQDTGSSSVAIKQTEETRAEATTTTQRQRTRELFESVSSVNFDLLQAAATTSSGSASAGVNSSSSAAAAGTGPVAVPQTHFRSTGTSGGAGGSTHSSSLPRSSNSTAEAHTNTISSASRSRLSGGGSSVVGPDASFDLDIEELVAYQDPLALPSSGMMHRRSPGEHSRSISPSASIGLLEDERLLLSPRDSVRETMHLPKSPRSPLGLGFGAHRPPQLLQTQNFIAVTPPERSIGHLTGADNSAPQGTIVVSAFDQEGDDDWCSGSKEFVATSLGTGGERVHEQRPAPPLHVLTQADPASLSAPSTPTLNPTPARTRSATMLSPTNSLQSFEGTRDANAHPLLPGEMVQYTPPTPVWDLHASLTLATDNPPLEEHSAPTDEEIREVRFLGRARPSSPSVEAFEPRQPTWWADVFSKVQARDAKVGPK